MTAGMLIRRGRIVWGSQVRAGASARASSWEKASRPAGQGHDQAPDTVLVEPLQGKAVKPGVLEAQLGSLVGPLSAHDDPHPLGPGGQVQQVSDLSDVRPLPGLSVSVVGRGPGGLGDGARGSAACARAA